MAETQQEWAKMTDNEKLEMLTDILTKAAADLSIRDRFLASPESARAMLAKLKPNVIFPSDFHIQFISEHETEHKTNSVLLKVPRYFGQGGAAPPIKIEDHLLCTYNWWR
jgi:hypothetical protein